MLPLRSAIPLLALLSLPALADPGGEPAPDQALGESALGPYFPRGPVAEAVGLLRAERPREALEKLPLKDSRNPVRFLRAMALDATGDHLGAAKAFRALAPDYPPLAARANCLAAEAFLKAKSFAEAATSFEACAADPVHGRQASLGRARALSGGGDVAGALEALRPSANRSGSQRAAALLLAAELQAREGRKAEALEKYRTIFVEEPTSAEAVTARNRAFALVRELGVSSIEPARLVERAERLFAAGAIRDALGELDSLRVEGLCGDQPCGYQRCVPPSTGFQPPEGFLAAGRQEDPAEPLMKAAHRFRIADAVDHEDAFDEPRPLPACAVVEPKGGDPVRCRAQFVRGAAARKQRAHTKAVDLLRPVYERCEDPDLRVRSLFLAQWSAAIIRDPDAVALGVVLAYQFPEVSLSDDGLFRSAKLLADAGDAAGERALLRHLVRFHHDDHRAEALFRIFWSHRLEGRPERGLWALQQLADGYESSGDGADSERGRYWWARTVAGEAVEEDRVEGVSRMQALARERPLTYYGLLARSWLDAHGEELLLDAQPQLAGRLDGPLRPGPLSSEPAFAAGVELLRLGFPQQAREMLMTIDLRKVERAGDAGREAVLLVAELIARTGDERTAHLIIRRRMLSDIRRADEPLVRRAASVAYPLMFREHIATVGRKHGYSPDLLQGLMREESALDPKALSHAGARGLTQLMPATARQVASALGIRRLQMDSLWEPSTNIQLGGTYLGWMLKKFGHPALAAAAYNAGPGAVGRWVSQRGHLRLDEFVEEIPYAETHGYVKRVLRSWAAYQFVHEGQLPKVSFDLPGQGG